MKRIHISRKKTILIIGVAAVSLAAALISGAVKAVKYRKYSSASF
ncbi:Hypothetical protein DPCES_0143 [Desulfitobacterium hafniense]|uniref:Uncharacterized protein n=1 Tax=Desulfitobacterium hafniense TaxID=49338 RepID=A0A098AVC0_DESHA|nr:hypothetical protein [Desulfitobacterium hafniense]CDX00030.1 Hypothetical protein DPCES_0143 [Desulfitobacterium hafniense]